MKKIKATAFDTLMTELMSDAGSDDMLKESMSLSPGRVKKIPLRYRIIALGFIQRMSLSEVNEMLRANNCAELYARSLWEASLIFAFNHGASYKEWQKLRDICFDFQNGREINDPYFSGKYISMDDIKHYIDENSDNDNGSYITKHRTSVVEEIVNKASNKEEEFKALLKELVKDFTPVSEKARYYFCKYLYYMLVTKIEEYAAYVDMSITTEDSFNDILHLFKGVTPLKKKKHTSEEIENYLMHADVSPGGVFDLFNRFFFGYISNDWMMVLIEFYGSANSIPESDIHTMAEHLRNYDLKKYEGLDDKEVINMLQEEEEKHEAELDAIYSTDAGSGRGYQRNRVGENTIRNYIKGALDIDRTTLICFLLFFGRNANLREEDKINCERLSKILKECRFDVLREEDDFDYFVIQFLEADDPIDYLMDQATWYAMQGENFYLYRVYKDSHRAIDFFS